MDSSDLWPTKKVRNDIRYPHPLVVHHLLASKFFRILPIRFFAKMRFGNNNGLGGSQTSLTSIKTIPNIVPCRCMWPAESKRWGVITVQNRHWYFQNSTGGVIPADCRLNSNRHASVPLWWDACVCWHEGRIHWKQHHPVIAEKSEVQESSLQESQWQHPRYRVLYQPASSIEGGHVRCRRQLHCMGYWPAS